MSLCLISQCAKDLDFKPLKPWSQALPAMAWNFRLLTGFDRDESLVFDLSSTSRSLVAALHACYPNLSLSELARLYVKLNSVKSLMESEDDWIHFFEFYQLRFQDSLIKCFEKINVCPDAFQNWISEKGVGPRELEILNATSIAELRPLLNRWPEWNLSKSEGCQILELAVELHLMKTDWSQILPLEIKTGSTLLEHLKNLRFPQATEKDRVRKMGIRSLPWPSQIQAQWSRQGDQAGIEIRFRVNSLNDLNKKLKGLGQVEQALGKPTSPITWNN